MRPYPIQAVIFKRRQQVIAAEIFVRLDFRHVHLGSSAQLNAEPGERTGRALAGHKSSSEFLGRAPCWVYDKRHDARKQTLARASSRKFADKLVFLITDLRFLRGLRHRQTRRMVS